MDEELLTKFALLHGWLRLDEEKTDKWIKEKESEGITFQLWLSKSGNKIRAYIQDGKVVHVMTNA